MGIICAKIPNTSNSFNLVLKSVFKVFIMRLNIKCLKCSLIIQCINEYQDIIKPN